jgi:hypothetical protein
VHIFLFLKNRHLGRFLKMCGGWFELTLRYPKLLVGLM